MRLAQPQEIPSLWEKISPWVSSIAERSRGRFEAVDIAERLVSGDFHLWLAEDESGMVMTEFSQYPRKRVVRACAIVGDGAKDWVLDADREIGEWAKEQGCEIFEGLARPGWERTFKQWKKTHVFLERDL